MRSSRQRLKDILRISEVVEIRISSMFKALSALFPHPTEYRSKERAIAK
jgi:hypothetical protein